MKDKVEPTRERFIPFSYSIDDYFRIGKSTYEDYLRTGLIEHAPDLIGPHRDLINKESQLIKLFKLDSIDEMCLSGIRMERNDNGYRRRIISTQNQIQFLSNASKADCPTSVLTWSLPFEGTREFSRFEMNVFYANREEEITGMMNLFFDMSFEGKDRFQILVSYDGLIPQLQDEPYTSYSVGGTFTFDGNRLQPGEYNFR